MSTNPGSVIGTNAAYGGRTSVKAFNDDLAMLLGAGILSGWGCLPKAEMTVQLGGDGSARDVAVAENVTGDRITINNRAEMPVEVTIDGAPESGSRIDLIVAYVNDPPTSSGSYVDNPDTCGLLVVSGIPSENPVAPSDGDIRTAITMDGASGETAFYVVLASVMVEAGVTNITADDITPGKNVSIKETATVDEELDATSNNPIANKTVAQAVDALNSSVRGLGTDINSLDAAVDALNSSVRGLDTDIDNLDANLRAYEGSAEIYTIAKTQWMEGGDSIEPFKYTATIEAAHSLSAKTIIELINNDAVIFAKYGFSIGGVSGQIITIYSFELPEGPVSLTVNYKEVA